LLVGIVPGYEAQRPVGELAERPEILILVPARPHAQHRRRRPALLDQFARQQHGVVEAAHQQQHIGSGAPGLGDLDRQVTRRGIVGHGLHDLIGHVGPAQRRIDSLLHRGAEGIVDVHEHRRLRGEAGRLKDLLLIDEGVAQDHGRSREIAEHELVALLRDRRSGGDVDDQGDAPLLGDLGDSRGLPGIEGSDQKLRALPDQPFGPRARDIRTGLGVAVHDLERRKPQLL
jgi:hypothetical protein